MRCDIKQYWDMTDADLREIYDHARAHDLLERVVYDAGLNWKLFQMFVRRAECFCAVRADGRWRGFFYLSHFEGATARLHLGLADDGGGGPAAGERLSRNSAIIDDDRPDRLARQVLDWCLATFEFRSLLVVVPAADQRANRLWAALGAERLAEIPGLCWLDKKKQNVSGSLFHYRSAAARPVPA